jgi:hypothetical protein
VKRRKLYEPVDRTETRLVWKKDGSWQQDWYGQLKGSQWPVKLMPEHPQTLMPGWALARAERQRRAKPVVFIVLDIDLLLDGKWG